jgi:hypothetical protein
VKKINLPEKYLESHHKTSKKERDASIVLSVPESIMRRNVQTSPIASLNNLTTSERILQRPQILNKLVRITTTEKTITQEIIITETIETIETPGTTMISKSAMTDLTLFTPETIIDPTTETQTEEAAVDTQTKVSPT